MKLIAILSLIFMCEIHGAAINSNQQPPKYNLNNISNLIDSYCNEHNIQDISKIINRLHRAKISELLNIAIKNNNSKEVISIIDLANKYGIKNQILNTIHSASGFGYPLEEAILHNANEMCKILITNNADVNARCFKDPEQTMLTLAIEHGHDDIVQTLINHNVNVNATDKYGRNSLCFAFDVEMYFFKDRSKIIKMLSLAGANEPEPFEI